MVTVAVRAPVAAGVNVTVKAQLADAATGPPARGHGATPEPATAKSPGFEPARAMLVMLRVAVPLLVRVTVCTGLVVLRRRSPKARLVGAKVTAGTMPVPASDTDCGLLAASSVMVTVAVRALAAVGVNVRLRRQLAPATTVAPFVQVVPAAMAKSPGFKPARAMLVMLRVAVPLLVRVTVCAGLVVLRRWSPKARLVGAKVTAGAMPIPTSDTNCGLPGASSVMVTVAVRAPVAAGSELMMFVLLSPPPPEPPPLVHVMPAAMGKSPGLNPARTMLVMVRVFFFNDAATTEIYALSLHDALPISKARLVGAKVTAGTIPVPASDTDCGLPGASSVMVTVAVRAPVAARSEERRVGKEGRSRWSPYP